MWTWHQRILERLTILKLFEVSMATALPYRYSKSNKEMIGCLDIAERDIYTYIYLSVLFHQILCISIQCMVSLKMMNIRPTDSLLLWQSINIRVYTVQIIFWDHEIKNRIKVNVFALVLAILQVSVNIAIIFWLRWLSF